jgi:hypothetical protein
MEPWWLLGGTGGSKFLVRVEDVDEEMQLGLDGVSGYLFSADPEVWVRDHPGWRLRGKQRPPRHYLPAAAASGGVLRT